MYFDSIHSFQTICRLFVTFIVTKVAEKKNAFYHIFFPIRTFLKKAAPASLVQLKFNGYIKAPSFKMVAFSTFL